MENRFGIKDFFQFLMLAAVIVLVLLAMKQFDRQYEQVRIIRSKTDQLNDDVLALKRRLDEGGFQAAPGSETGRSGGPRTLDVFASLVKAEKAEGFARGDWLVDNFGTKIGRLTPLVSTDLYQQWVEARVMETLATRDANTLKWVPLLAESWEVKDHTARWNEYVKPLKDKGLSPDALLKEVRKDPKAPLAMEMVFKLRRGVEFSDSTPMTADDVVFTFDWVRNTEVNAPRVRAYLENLKEVKALGSHEVYFSFTDPYFQSFETVVSLSVMSRKFYSRFTPNEFNERTGLLIGTGPYRLENPEDWTPGKSVELVRNRRYWGVEAPFDRLVYREIEDEAAEEVTFGNGEMDIYACQPEQYERLLKRPEILAMSQHFKYPSPLNGYTYVGWNQKRKKGSEWVSTPFDDKRVRQAMTLLIDRDRIGKEVFLGYATTASGPFNPDGPQSAPGLKPWPFDEKRGKELLAQAGFADRNGDGAIEGPDGKPFGFKLSYPSGSATFQRVVLFLKDSFARAGIKMEPDPMDWPVLLDRIKRGEFDACSLGWGGVIESDPYQIFHSSQIEDQGDNRTHYVNKKLDALIETARQTLDDDKRMTMWHEAHRILHEDQPYTFLFNRPSLVFLNKRMSNVETTKLGLNYVRLYPNPIPWFVPRPMQRYTR